MIVRVMPACEDMKFALRNGVASVSQSAYWLGCILSLLRGASACTMGAEVQAPGSFEPFQIIAERNIFAPKSSQQSAESEKSSQRTLDRLLLTGVMSYEKGQFAFFEGSQPDFKKVLRVGGDVGGCTLTAVTSERVKLKAGELEFELQVGTCLLRDQAGRWRLGSKADNILPVVEIASPSTRSLGSQRSGTTVKAEEVLEAEPDKSTRWLEKKMAKYLEGMDSEIKKEKHGGNYSGAFHEDKPKKPEKRPRQDGR